MLKNPDIQRYEAVLADETRSIVFMCGGPNAGVIPVNTGPLYTPRGDVRKLWGCWALVTRAGAVVPGLVMSLVGLTGMTGDLWLYQIESGVQGSGQLVTLRQTPTLVTHGVGVLLSTGTLVTGDIVQIGATYD
jgi:hypothetical protein